MEIRDRANRLLTEGRVTVAYVDGAYVAGVCEDDPEVCNVGFDADRGWWCSCGAGPECPHVVAIRLVTERSLRAPAGAPEVAGSREADPKEAGVKEAPGPPGEPAPGEAPTPDKASRRRRTVAWGGGLALVGLGVVGLAWAAGRGLTTPSDEPAMVIPTVTAGPTASLSPSLSPTVSPSASPSISPSVQGPTVARFPGTARGSSLTLQVQPFEQPDPDCDSHFFGTEGAYQTDCRSWAGFDLAWFFVDVENTGSSPLRVSLDDFVLTTTGGRQLHPEDAASKSSNPKSFFPRDRRIGPGKTVSGWITFDDTPEFVAASLVLRAMEESVAIDFEGEHQVVPRG